MADANDVASAIASALTEVSVTGIVDVDLDGKTKVLPIGDTKNPDVVVRVMVDPGAKAD